MLVGTVVDVTDSPADLTLDGDYRSNDTLFFYDEGQTTLTDSLSIGGIELPAGSVVCSYYLMLAPADGSDHENDFEITFTETVLTIATTDRELDRSDVLTIPGTMFEDRRELELLFRQDRGDVEGNTVSGELNTSADWVDSARVITDCS